jgi:WD40 repeat protein
MPLNVIARQLMARTTYGPLMPWPSIHCEDLDTFLYLILIAYIRHNTLASAGSDGTVTIWDHKLKKRLRQYPKFNNPVSSVAFNCDGTSIAIATSYTWDEGEQGIKGAESPMITVRQLGDEIKVSLTQIK